MSESEELHLCEKCNVKWDRLHESERDCIEDLHLALVNQSEDFVERRRSWRDTGTQIATRYLAILQELELEPECGVQYLVMDYPPEPMAHPDDPVRPTVAYATQVQGIFAAIRKKFEEACDWSPLLEAREELRKEQILNRRMEKLLIQVESQAFKTGTMTDPEFAAELKALLHPEDGKE